MTGCSVNVDSFRDDQDHPTQAPSIHFPLCSEKEEPFFFFIFPKAIVSPGWWRKKIFYDYTFPSFTFFPPDFSPSLFPQTVFLQTKTYSCLLPSKHKQIKTFPLLYLPLELPSSGFISFLCQLSWKRALYSPLLLLTLCSPDISPQPAWLALRPLTKSSDLLAAAATS